ncbi:2OG-Fe(II) oxygenase [Polynucleobacter paneuropaeus]|nr:2OG-Fe(II) oxygenase [Polynucleobacter paneuropaeus]
MLNINEIKKRLTVFRGNAPFDHCIIDNFFIEEHAKILSEEFLDYESNKWFSYKNPLEDKKSLNDWNLFPKTTYKTFFTLLSREFVKVLESAVGGGGNLQADYGLHGGGWHICGTGGNLNPHLDYSIHPKLNLQRKLNIIIYLSEEFRPNLHGGHLGLYEHDQDSNQPGALKVEVEPIFNRAVIFDTTQNSWHGISRALTQPDGIYRKSLAIYYLCNPAPDAPSFGRALYAPRENQKNDKDIEELIKLRSGIETSFLVYKAASKTQK